MVIVFSLISMEKLMILLFKKQIHFHGQYSLSNLDVTRARDFDYNYLVKKLIVGFIHSRNIIKFSQFAWMFIAIQSYPYLKIDMVQK